MQQAPPPAQGLAIRFAPLRVPAKRRRQTLAVLLWGSLFIVVPAFFFYLCSFPRFWPIAIIYISWIALFDTAPNHGGRPSEKLRRAQFWKLFAGYFPITLVKTVDLPPDRTYVFGYHPHGIIGVGAMGSFASDATGFSQLFPGIRTHLLTLSTNFLIPVYRDILLALGICSVSSSACQNVLKQGKGSSITIVVGGAAESLSARPGTADLILKRRLGFIKLAVRQGADLVPVFSFGENDIFDQLSSKKRSKLRAIQQRFQGTFGFTLPIFFGRGIFNYSIGMMPFRNPITSVVGRPIAVKQNAHPTMEELERYQVLYIEELMRIWDDYKDVYAPYRKRDLAIVS